MEGKKLKQIISEKGIKQSWIANKLNVSNALVSQWVKETKPISENHSKLLKEILN